MPADQEFDDPNLRDPAQAALIHKAWERSPTRDAVRREVDALKRLRDVVPPRNAFGDDNVAAINAQMVVLDMALTAHTIKLLYGVPGGAEDGMDNYVLLNARQAWEWMHGLDDGEPLSVGWGMLAHQPSWPGAAYSTAKVQVSGGDAFLAHWTGITVPAPKQA